MAGRMREVGSQCVSTLIHTQVTSGPQDQFLGKIQSEMSLLGLVRPQPQITTLCHASYCLRGGEQGLVGGNEGVPAEQVESPAWHSGGCHREGQRSTGRALCGEPRTGMGWEGCGSGWRYTGRAEWKTLALPVYLTPSISLL